MDMASFARFDCFVQDLSVATIASISRYSNFFEQATALVVGREIQVIGTNHKEQGGEVNQFLATLVAVGQKWAKISKMSVTDAVFAQKTMAQKIFI